MSELGTAGKKDISWEALRCRRNTLSKDPRALLGQSSGKGTSAHSPGKVPCGGKSLGHPLAKGAPRTGRNVRPWIHGAQGHATVRAQQARQRARPHGHVTDAHTRGTLTHTMADPHTRARSHVHTQSLTLTTREPHHTLTHVLGHPHTVTLSSPGVPVLCRPPTSVPPSACPSEAASARSTKPGPLPPVLGRARNSVRCKGTGGHVPRPSGPPLPLGDCAVTSLWARCGTGAGTDLAKGPSSSEKLRGRSRPSRPLSCRVQHLRGGHRHLQPWLRHRGHHLRASVLPEEAGLPAEAGVHVLRLRR